MEQVMDIGFDQGALVEVLMMPQTAYAGFLAEARSQGARVYPPIQTEMDGRLVYVKAVWR